MFEGPATPPLAVFALTVLALLAFAANSVLGRFALASGDIDPASYTGLRLAAGAVVLALLLWTGSRSGERRRGRPGSWAGAAMLFAYAGAFSFAYLSLDTGTGALVLFGAVQFTIIGASLVRGHRPSGLEWLGMAFAVAGFVYLMLPGATAPSPAGFVMMAASGVAWGFYTLIGRGSRRPLADTAGNFVMSVPLAGVLLAVAVIGGLALRIGWFGGLLAIVSGGITSALGYAVWYRVLPSLTPTLAAVVQLLVPVIAALGGVLIVGEAVTLRLAAAGVLILGGVAIATFGRRPASCR
jgi:drug/metabolite transporter (DMT)-like permease